MSKENIKDRKRIDERLEVIWDAEATIDEVTYPCNVTNVSTAGALLSLDLTLECGVDFLLDIKGFGEYAAEIVWCNQPSYGVRLLLGHDLKLKDHADDVGLIRKNESE